MSQGRHLSNLNAQQALSFLLLVACFFFDGMAMAQESQQSVFWYRSPVSMGAEGFQQASSRRLFYIMSSAENPEFQGLKITRKSHGGDVQTPSGGELQKYPSNLNLRITASSIDAHMFAATDPIRVSDDTDLNSMLLGLRYQLKVYRGLNMTIIQPTSVRLIGVPADTPSDERIYRVSFDTEGIPVDARLCLEVFSPKGEKLTRFHLELL